MAYDKGSYQLDPVKFGNLNLCNQDLEIQIIETSRSNHKNKIILNVYRPPSGNQNAFLA